MSLKSAAVRYFAKKGAPRTVKPISRSRRNDGFGGRSGPSKCDRRKRALRPERALKIGLVNERGAPENGLWVNAWVATGICAGAEVAEAGTGRRPDRLLAHGTSGLTKGRGLLQATGGGARSAPGVSTAIAPSRTVGPKQLASVAAQCTPFGAGNPARIRRSTSVCVIVESR
jgi:hypothetical protein